MQDAAEVGLGVGAQRIKQLLLLRRPVMLAIQLTLVGGVLGHSTTHPDEHQVQQVGGAPAQACACIQCKKKKKASGLKCLPKWSLK